MSTTFPTIAFSFYGFGVRIQTQDDQTLQNIRRDYSYFIDTTVTPKVFFEVFNASYDYNQCPNLFATLYSPRNICYTKDHLSYIDYFGKGLSIIDHSTNTYKVYCPDPQLRHEIVFLSILSLLGQELDAKKIHRVHGLGIEFNQQAILFLMPSGGGKTTLLLELLKNDSIKLISEDSPLIDSQGNALPFPIRIGVSESNKPSHIPQEELHLIERMEFGSKYVIDTAFFKNKLSRSPVKVKYILCGKRCLGNDCSIKPLSKYATLNELITNSVIGVGLYQGIEFLLQHGLWELLKKSGVVFSRFVNSLKILSQSKTYTFVIGHDRAKNLETFLNFCHENL